ncbi:hypothetical protein A7326_20060 [Stenotrophomonas maltophilia]|nr:hypothetical protein A7326_20060 [Stenotrophomonas maltophilia]
MLVAVGRRRKLAGQCASTAGRCTGSDGREQKRCQRIRCLGRCGISCFSQHSISLRIGKHPLRSLGGELGPSIIRIAPHSALVAAEGREYHASYRRPITTLNVLEGHTMKLPGKVAVPEVLDQD